jgi:hypothetical protein
VLRDIDIFTDLARDNLVGVSISIPTLDPETKRTLEPRAASPQARMRGTGPVAELIRSRFKVARRRLGLDAIERFRLDTTLFRRPGIAGAQMSLGF